MRSRYACPQRYQACPMGAKADMPVATQLTRRKLLYCGARNHGLRSTTPVAQLAATIYEETVRSTSNQV